MKVAEQFFLSNVNGLILIRGYEGVNSPTGLFQLKNIKKIQISLFGYLIKENLFTAPRK